MGHLLAWPRTRAPEPLLPSVGIAALHLVDVRRMNVPSRLARN